MIIDTLVNRDMSDIMDTLKYLDDQRVREEMLIGIIEIAKRNYYEKLTETENDKR